MRCAFIRTGLALAVGGMLFAADPPAESAPVVPTALPQINFTPAAVSINEIFKSDQPAPAMGGREMMMYEGMADQNTMKLKILATTDEHWKIVKVENPVVIDAQTASGETLLAPSADDGRFAYSFVDGSFMRQGPPPPAYVNLVLAIPQHPTTSLRTLVATVDLILAREDSLKTAKLKITTDESDPLQPDGCDVTFTRIDDKVKIKYTMGAFAYIKSMSFLDAAGEACTGHTNMQSMENTRFTMTMQFNGKVPATASLEYYGDTHRVQATLRLTGYPLIGVGSPRDIRSHAADSVHEVHNVVAKAPPSPAPHPPLPVPAPGAPAAPAATPALPAHAGGVVP